MTTYTTAQPAGTAVQASAGSATVVLTHGVKAWTVTCWQGSERVDGWVHTYGSLADARAEAIRATRVFRQHGSEQGIARRRLNLIDERGRLNRLARTADRLDRIDQIDTELDGLQDLTTRANTPAFIADQRTRHAA